MIFRNGLVFEQHVFCVENRAIWGQSNDIHYLTRKCPVVKRRVLYFSFLSALHAFDMRGKLSIKKQAPFKIETHTTTSTDTMKSTESRIHQGNASRVTKGTEKVTKEQDVNAVRFLQTKHTDVSWLATIHELETRSDVKFPSPEWKAAALKELEDLTHAGSFDEIKSCMGKLAHECKQKHALQQQLDKEGGA